MPDQNTPSENLPDFGGDKILVPQITQSESLEGWANVYFQFHVVGSSEHTVRAKQGDLSKFIQYFYELGSTRLDDWTPAVTKSFQRDLQLSTEAGGRGLKATSVNRVMASLSHFAGWLTEQRPLLAGDPFQGVRNVTVDAPAWNGLHPNIVTRLKMACDQRLKICTRKNQNPQLEGAVFYTLLGTGLRESELVRLTTGQYHSRGFHQVKRKGDKVTRKVSVPSDAREWLDAYLATREQAIDTEPLLLTKSGNPLQPKDVYRIVQRLAAQASVDLDDPINITPHMLRHTFLKKVSDKHGVHVAQEMSGNVGIREVFRYTKPSQEEMDQIAEGLI